MPNALDARLSFGDRRVAEEAVAEATSDADARDTVLAARLRHRGGYLSECGRGLRFFCVFHARSRSLLPTPPPLSDTHKPPAHKLR